MVGCKSVRGGSGGLLGRSGRGSAWYGCVGDGASRLDRVGDSDGRRCKVPEEVDFLRVVVGEDDMLRMSEIDEERDVTTVSAQKIDTSWSAKTWSLHCSVSYFGSSVPCQYPSAGPVSPRTGRRLVCCVHLLPCTGYASAAWLQRHSTFGVVFQRIPRQIQGSLLGPSNRRGADHCFMIAEIISPTVLHTQSSVC